MNRCRCSTCLALAVEATGHSLVQPFDHPHTHVPIAGEFGFSNNAIPVSGLSTGGSSLVSPGTGRLTLTGFPPTVTISKTRP